MAHDYLFHRKNRRDRSAYQLLLSTVPPAEPAAEAEEVHFRWIIPARAPGFVRAAGSVYWFANFLSVAEIEAMPPGAGHMSSPFPALRSGARSVYWHDVWPAVPAVVVLTGESFIPTYRSRRR